MEVHQKTMFIMAEQYSAEEMRYTLTIVTLKIISQMTKEVQYTPTAMFTLTPMALRLAISQAIKQTTLPVEQFTVKKI